MFAPFALAVGLAAGIGLGLVPLSALAQRESPVQSGARPLGLDIVAPVNRARSDRPSRRFHRNAYPVIYDNLGLGPTDTNWTGVNDIVALDPSDIVLVEEYDVRVYFVNERSDSANALGFFDRPASQPDNNYAGINPQLIFPDASSAVDFWDGTGQITRNQATPLAPGDFVDIGTFSADTNLDFFLLPNGQTPAAFSEADINPGGFQQFVAFAQADSPYLVLRVEEQFTGADNEFDDAVFAVDLGVNNVRGLIAASVPLPAPVLALLLPLLLLVRRQLQAYRAKRDALSGKPCGVAA
ncbi:MAG: DUF4114 domain-containing protein [Alphaproteobacteria bacterium]|nr:DUF4114 domain-containing protein [Alphaproteobacteria bacterium SS10]